MDKYINGNLIKRILVFKTRKHPEWKHRIADTKFLFWKRHIDYWYLLDPCFGTYSEKGMLESISKRTSFYKDGIVYQKPHIILEFSERHDESIYFDSDEEMEGWLESFRQEFGNHLFIWNNTFIPVQSLAQVVKNSSYWLKRGGVPDERLELTQFNFESPTMRSIIMAELIFLPNGKCDLKFHANIKNFKRVEIVKHKKNFFKVYVDRNDSVYDVKRCEVITWKTIERGKRKVNVPDKVDEVRDVHLFDKIKGNPFKIAVTKIICEIEAQELLS